MAKGDKFYFDNFVETTELSKKAAKYLVESLESYNPDNIETMLKEMHEIEHSADVKKHEMSNALAKAFVTPVDREDLDLISKNLDDVTDNIEEVLQRFYVDRITTINPDAIVFAKELVATCVYMRDMMVEFENFRKPAKLRSLILEINNKEEACDVLYLKSLVKLRDFTTDILETMYWREIFDHLEACVDSCEHIGDCIDTVVMKNT